MYCLLMNCTDNRKYILSQLKSHRMALCNAMLLTVLGILIAVETILDRRELLGSHCSEEEIAGRNVSEILVGQPVIPDRICMLLSKELNAEEWRFEYEADYVFPHCYPYMAMLISNGRVILCEVRDSAGKSCYDDL